jgi:hypothetical protein
VVMKAGPTRYRTVVLTSWDRTLCLAQSEWCQSK